MNIVFFLVSVLLIAATFDVRSHRIPNWLTLSSALAGLVYHSAVSGWYGLLFSSEGLLLGGAFLIPFYLKGGMGAGDVKLLAAVGALLGPGGVFWAFLGTALAGGVYAVALLAGSRFRKEMGIRCKQGVGAFILTRNFRDLEPEMPASMPVLCYGVAIAIGTFFSLLKAAYLE